MPCQGLRRGDGCGGGSRGGALAEAAVFDAGMVAEVVVAGRRLLVETEPGCVRIGSTEWRGHVEVRRGGEAVVGESGEAAEGMHMEINMNAAMGEG